MKTSSGEFDFHFDDILGQESSQEAVFERVSKQVVESAVNGYNGKLFSNLEMRKIIKHEGQGTIIAYGQTGSGKTHTMMGSTNVFTSRGVCARSIAHIFNAIRINNTESTSVRVSYIEVYNEQLYDLLDFTETPGERNLVVMETKSGTR